MANEKALSEAFFYTNTITISCIYTYNDYCKWKRILLSFPSYTLARRRKTFSSVSELLDRFFFGKAERDRVKQQAHDLERFMQNEKIKREKLIKLEKHCKMLEKQININYLESYLQPICTL